jgi:hypothetical protein
MIISPVYYVSGLCINELFTSLLQANILLRRPKLIGAAIYYVE